MLPYHTAGIPALQPAGPPFREDAFPMPPWYPGKKRKVRLEYRYKINPLPFKKRFNSRNSVQQQPERYLPQCLAGGQVLGQHNEIVPEVQEYLSLVALRQRAAA